MAGLCQLPSGNFRAEKRCEPAQHVLDSERAEMWRLPRQGCFPAFRVQQVPYPEKERATKCDRHSVNWLRCLNPKGGLFFGQIMLEINPETQFESISSAGELEKGDQIKAEYVEKDGKKVASRIMKIAGTAQEGKT